MFPFVSGYYFVPDKNHYGPKFSHMHILKQVHSLIACNSLLRRETSVLEGFFKSQYINFSDQSERRILAISLKFVLIMQVFMSDGILEPLNV